MTPYLATMKQFFAGRIVILRLLKLNIRLDKIYQNS